MNEDYKNPKINYKPPQGITDKENTFFQEWKTGQDLLKEKYQREGGKI